MTNHDLQRKDRAMRRIATFALTTSLAFASAACGSDIFGVDDLNNPGLEDFLENPTEAAVRDAVQGLQITMRNGIDASTGYVAHLGILGRESFTFDGADPRFVDEMVGGDLNPGSGAFGGSNWAGRYTTLKTADLVLNALDQVPEFSEQERAAIRGFTKTIMGLEYLLLVNTRWDNGIVFEITTTAEDPPAPFVSRQEALTRIGSLLDEALGDLEDAGPGFPFSLAPGLGSFATPASFRLFNRALAARVAAYRKDYAGALQALGASFLDREGSLDLGAFYDYSPGAGDNENDLATDDDIVAHPSFRADAQSQPGGTPDQRLVERTTTIPATSQAGLSTDLDFTLYQLADDPVPIIRNEELLLLLAEALWFTGDRDEAIEVLNEVRQRSGGLEPIDVPATDEAFVTALLYERRYSLMFEGGHRWIDARRFDRLGDIEVDRPGDVVPGAFPIPRSECLVRGMDSPCGVDRAG